MCRHLATRWPLLGVSTIHWALQIQACGANFRTFATNYAYYYCEAFKGFTVSSGIQNKGHRSRGTKRCPSRLGSTGRCDTRDLCLFMRVLDNIPFTSIVLNWLAMNDLKATGKESKPLPTQTFCTACLNSSIDTSPSWNQQWDL